MVTGANGNLEKNVLLHQGAGLSLKAISYENTMEGLQMHLSAQNFCNNMHFV